MKFFKKFWNDRLKRPHKLAKTVDTGSGRTVLLIHGLGTTGKTWQPLVKLVNKKNWHVLGFDLLGFGRSPKPQTNSYDVHEHAKAVLASLDRSAKQKKLVIIGHSMGCLIASHIAWLKPNMVEHLILFEPPLFADSPEFRSHKRRRDLYFTLYEEIIQRPKLLLGYSKLAARFAEGRSLSLNTESWIPFARSLKNTIIKQEAYDQLKNIKVPTDIIYGKFDFLVTRKEVKEMLQANKYIKFHLVNDVHDISPRGARYIVKLLNQL